MLFYPPSTSAISPCLSSSRRGEVLQSSVNNLLWCRWPDRGLRIEPPPPHSSLSHDWQSHLWELRCSTSTKVKKKTKTKTNKQTNQKKTCWTNSWTESRSWSQTAAVSVDGLVRQWEEQDGEWAVSHWAGLTWQVREGLQLLTNENTETTGIR